MANVDTSADSLAESTGLPLTPDQPGAIPPPEGDGHQPFRFAAGASLSPARQEILQSWHRPFLRIAAASLRTVLRLDAELELETVQVESCAQLLAKRGAQTQGVIFRMAPQTDLWLLDLPLPLAVLAVERMMGSTTEKLPAAADAHELTELDQIIFQQFASGLLADYARNWLPHRELKPEIFRSVRNLRNTRALGHGEDDLMVRVDLRLVVKDTKTPLSLHLPIAAAEELLQRLGADEESAQHDAPAFKHDPRSPLASVPVPVSVRWQGFQITLSEVAALAPGDLLVLDHKKCEHGVVFLGDRARFAGKVAREAHKTLITLTNPLD
jgi:flagellar motor switch protein FliM